MEAGNKQMKYGSIVAMFNIEKQAGGQRDVHCPNFWEVKPYNGCRVDCLFCYLNGTFKYKPDGKAPYQKD